MTGRSASCGHRLHQCDAVGPGENQVEDDEYGFLRLQQIGEIMVVAGDQRGVAGTEQCVAHEPQHLRVIVHDQDTRPFFGFSWRCAQTALGVGFASGVLRQRHRKGKPRALARPGALDPNASAMCFDQPLANGEPQSTSHAALCVAGVAVLSEQVRHAFRRQPPALVRDRDRDVRAVGLGGDPDRSALRGVLGGVGKQVVQHLHDASPIRHHPGQIRRQFDEHRVPAAAQEERGPRLLDQLAHLRGLGRHRERAAVDPPHVEQVPDQPAHAIGLLVDDSEKLPRLGGGKALRSTEYRRSGPLDGGKRRAQLVAHHAEKLRPHAVERLERRQILQGDHDRLDRAVPGPNRRRVDKRADAAPVFGGKHDLLRAHRPGVGQLAGQGDVIEHELASVGQAAGDRIEHVLGRATGRAQGFDETPGLAVDHRRLPGLRVEHHDADRRGLDQGLEVGARALLGPVVACVDDGGRALRGEQQQHLLVLVGEFGPANFVSQEEVADMDAEMAHRRAHAGT